MVDPIMFVPVDNPGGEVTTEARVLSLAGFLMGATMGLAERLSKNPDSPQQPHLACVMALLFDNVRKVYPNGAEGVDELYALAKKLGYATQEVPATEVIQ